MYPHTSSLIRHLQLQVLSPNLELDKREKLPRSTKEPNETKSTITQRIKWSQLKDKNIELFSPLPH